MAATTRHFFAISSKEEVPIWPLRLLVIGLKITFDDLLSISKRLTGKILYPFLFLTVMSVNLLGDRLSIALDARQSVDKGKV